ncbi:MULTISPECIES: sensor histidine kinase [Sphingobacterium]|uniref:histidine kinase n=1 Tax=Sphingobacterium cellulitidis TaxID=1768011 RepID=A0A8H9FZ04_9SPHI|nr:MULTISPECIES: HAMP domain-containing sensor histidine kinase [Sphingobacterium]MBA8985455.1 two-component sensor histidine kinase [Sphingobacterium soli]OYD41637.1 sensor histidine kinase [Sphingobacterium cellulitidis]OYD45782.1 sensor histidine kinase [Sphingobacterium cellulitidis]WFB63876.1 HAMP domain-containing sensor histidine kinase [Sphingobacterium sp. WM]GGE09524.1 two-component sensor histidine kinase [Sphingobacterium soli]
MKQHPYRYNKQQWKFFLFLFAALIAAASLLYTNYLVKNLSKSERTKAEVWAMSTQSIVSMPDVDDQFISFIYAVRDSLSLPAIITKENGDIIFWRDLDSTKTNIHPSSQAVDTNLVYDPPYFEKQLEKMKKSHPAIHISLDTGEKWLVYYHDSKALSQLRIFPYIQLSLIAVFLIVAYTVFNSIRDSEQNLVWVGMAKEAAHQLGTPISSMMGWLELARITYQGRDNALLDEMERDVQRLEIVADRFSKIGSTPSLSNHVIFKVVEDYVNYFKVRTSKRISFELTGDQQVEAKLNVQVFDWIVENLLKNAVNAIEGEGKITVNISENIAKEEIFIDISDTGKGIPRSNWETIFQPGYTTRQRGWGLGLSLTKRMVYYHRGQIFVKESELGKGTTFRIVLKSNLRYEPTQI